MSKKTRTSFSLLIRHITTIHGTNWFSSLRGRSLRVWCCMMLANVALTLAFVMVIKQKFNENQIITQINANCKVSQVPFPAVSICNYNMVSLRESSNIARLLQQHNRSELEIQAFFKALPLLTDYSKNSRGIGHFTDIMKILKHHYFTMDTIMEEIHQKCEDLLLHCSFNRKQMKCDTIFSLIKTYQGYCCAFNYAALNDGTEVSSGLQIVINVEPNDYPSWSNVPYYGAKILVSDPNDYPETTILYRYIAPGELVNIKVEAMVFQSEADLRRVDAMKRGCWFYDEAVLEHTDRYSFETCNSECRMKTYLETCGCLPYKYPREKSIRVCEFEDLQCLNNVTVFKSKKEMDCKPTCFQECRDKKYAINSDLVPFLGYGFPNITKNHNISELAELQVYFGKSNCNCYKLMLLIDVNYFIATYGGVFSLCFGGSILTLFELTYLLIAAVFSTLMREIKNFIKNRKQGY